MTIYEKLLKIQLELKAPKSQYNAFGKYNYRTSEDILEALKQLLDKNKATIIISDKPIIVGERFYIESTVKLIDIETGEMIETTAQAREQQDKKGMDASQVTGATSSYARKYALNGMFCIDDTKDSDNKDQNSKDIYKKAENFVNKNVNTKITKEQMKMLFGIASGTEGIIVPEMAKEILKYSIKLLHDNESISYNDIDSILIKDIALIVRQLKAVSKKKEEEIKKRRIDEKFKELEQSKHAV